MGCDAKPSIGTSLHTQGQIASMRISADIATSNRGIMAGMRASKSCLLGGLVIILEWRDS